jgi:hypothetical protein
MLCAITERLSEPQDLVREPDRSVGCEGDDLGVLAITSVLVEIPAATHVSCDVPRVLWGLDAL